ncbi:MAG: NUDIX hydrolase [Balneolales bacterium]
MNEPGSDLKPDSRYVKTVRVRANGLLTDGDALLMVNLISPVTGGAIWMPPGGGVRFGERLTNAVERELREETGLEVLAGPLWYIHEVRSQEVHAVEFYFHCEKRRGTVQKGVDPELPECDQIIRDVAFIPFDQLDHPDVYPRYLQKGFPADCLDQSVPLPKII